MQVSTGVGAWQWNSVTLAGVWRGSVAPARRLTSRQAQRLARLEQQLGVGSQQGGRRQAA